MRFELIAGTHIDAAGTEFQQGDILESNIDLSARWGHEKFRAYHGPVLGKKCVEKKDMEGAKVDGVEAAIVPDHSLPEETTATTAPPDAAPAATTTTSDPGGQGGQEGTTGGKSGGENNDEPTDKTEDFPKAGENGLKVLKVKRNYHVYDAGDLKDSLNGDEALTNKESVTAWIDNYLKDDGTGGGDE